MVTILARYYFSAIIFRKRGKYDLAQIVHAFRYIALSRSSV